MKHIAPAVLIVFFTTCVAGQAPAQARSNVVIVVFDDAGFADIGSFGSELC